MVTLSRALRALKRSYVRLSGKTMSSVSRKGPAFLLVTKAAISPMVRRMGHHGTIKPPACQDGGRDRLLRARLSPRHGHYLRHHRGRRLVMPNVPRANTNLTCIMLLGERVADGMRVE